MIVRGWADRPYHGRVQEHPCALAAIVTLPAGGLAVQVRRDDDGLGLALELTRDEVLRLTAFAAFGTRNPTPAT